MRQTNIRIEPLKKEIFELQKFAKFFYNSFSEVSPRVSKDTAVNIVNLILNVYAEIIPLHNKISKQIFVAKDRDGNFIGYVILSKAEDRDFDILEYLYVMPEYRNQGIGTALVKAILGVTDKDIELYVEPEKEFLIKFYESLGFKNEGLIERPKAIDRFGNVVQTNKYYKLVYRL